MEDQTQKEQQKAFSTYDEELEAQRQQERKQRDFFTKLLGNDKPKRACYERPNPRDKPNIIMSTPTSREERHNMFSRVALTRFENFIEQSEPLKRENQKPLSQGLFKGSRELVYARSRSYESSSPSHKEIKSAKRISIQGQELQVNEENARATLISPRSMAKVKVKRKGAEIFRSRHFAHMSRDQTEDSLDFIGGSPLSDTKYGEDLEMMRYLRLHGGMMDETDPKRFRFLKRGSYKRTAQ